MLGSLLALIANGWTAYSFAATLVGGTGFVLIAIAILAAIYLPLFPRVLRNLLVGAGVALILGAALYQAGQAKGAHEAFARDAERAIAAERKRADAAERVMAADAARAAQDLAAAQADTRKLQELNDALAHDPRRNGVCLPRDLSRGLRAL
ncbi:hypothetical protein [Methylobacterium sp. WL120]|uniref:hypothetical protein n=1 Tax=Methylobacterium sp. WL120 TaxID=2603887 RepID=UPI0011CC496B|nr:hypothetical protein [Methylobacterium sp. WL120]TXM65498.1 hypothetical protein FV229_15475 [Methylobacterium sp. WL120]